MLNSKPKPILNILHCETAHYKIQFKLIYYNYIKTLTSEDSSSAIQVPTTRQLSMQ